MSVPHSVKKQAKRRDLKMLMKAGTCLCLGVVLCASVCLPICMCLHVYKLALLEIGVIYEWGKGQANVVLVINVVAPQAFRLAASPPPMAQVFLEKELLNQFPLEGTVLKKSNCRHNYGFRTASEGLVLLFSLVFLLRIGLYRANNHKSHAFSFGI